MCKPSRSQALEGRSRNPRRSSYLARPGADGASSRSGSSAVQPRTRPRPHRRRIRPLRENKPSFINEMNAVGLENLDADELVALKIQGVTPAYIREIRSTGLIRTRMR